MRCSTACADTLNMQVKQVACGMRHTLLLATGRDDSMHSLSLLGCGLQRHGQLGPIASGDDHGHAACGEVGTLI